jgi:hypothetical protein
VELARQPGVKYEHYQEYLARIPGLKAKPFPISLEIISIAGCADFSI